MEHNVGFSTFTELHLDVFKEIGTIGAGNAVSSLSKLLGKKVDMSVPVVNLEEFKNIANFVGGPETLVYGILVQITGDINGIIIFLVKQQSAGQLVSFMMNRPVADERQLNEIEQSALQEIGNIMASSYLGSLSGLTHKKIIPSVPYLCIDMANAVLSVPAIEFGKVADRALFIESVFKADQSEVSGYFILVPDLPSFHTILTSLGVE